MKFREESQNRGRPGSVLERFRYHYRKRWFQAITRRVEKGRPPYQKGEVPSLEGWLDATERVSRHYPLKWSVAAFLALLVLLGSSYWLWSHLSLSQIQQLFSQPAPQQSERALEMDLPNGVDQPSVDASPRVESVEPLQQALLPEEAASPVLAEQERQPVTPVVEEAEPPEAVESLPETGPPPARLSEPRSPEMVAPTRPTPLEELSEVGEGVATEPVVERLSQEQESEVATQAEELSGGRVLLVLLINLSALLLIVLYYLRFMRRR